MTWVHSILCPVSWNPASICMCAEFARIAAEEKAREAADNDR